VQTPHSKIAGGDALESHDEMLFIVVHQVGLDPSSHPQQAEAN
jgi:hypothetical protein